MAPPHPRLSASWLARHSWGWATPLIETGRRRPLSQRDLWPLPPHLDATQLADTLERAWRRQRDSSALPWIVLRLYAPSVLASAALAVARALLSLADALVVREIVRLVVDPQASALTGLAWAALLCAGQVGEAVLEAHWHDVRRTRSCAGRAALLCLLHRALLTLPDADAGRLATLDVDVVRVQKVVERIDHLLSAPLILAACFALLYSLVGPSMWAGAAVVLLLFPVSWATAQRFRRHDVVIAAEAEARLRRLGEFVHAILPAKLLAAERVFVARVAESRARELVALWGYVSGYIGVRSVMQCAGLVISAALFATHVARGAALTAAVVWPALLVLTSTLEPPIFLLPYIVATGSAGYTSAMRLDAFLRRAPVEGYVLANEGGVHVDGLQCCWPGSPTATVLSDVSLAVPRGQLVAVVGLVGAGKSALLAALLGEMSLLGGRVSVGGSVGYVPQQAWVRNATLRDNVLAGRPFHEARYRRTLEVCGLLADVAQLAAGDQTEIGERGVTLSGGQKQRVSLARAVYERRDVYLFDDPLSALDVHVGAHVFAQAIAGDLAGATRILVTHQVQCLPSPAIDCIVVLEGGRVKARGTYAELVAGGINFAVLDGGHGSSSPSEGSEGSGAEAMDLGEAEAEAKDDRRLTGAVDASVYRAYLGAMGGRRFWAAVALLQVGLHVGALGPGMWLTACMAAPTAPGAFIAGLVGISLLQAAAATARHVTFFKGCWRAAGDLHERTVAALARAPLGFFHRTPTGVILNALSADQGEVDRALPSLLSDCLVNAGALATAVLLLGSVTPAFFLCVVPVARRFLALLDCYRASVRELTRLDSAARARVTTHLGESADGVVSIRAYGAGFLARERREMEARASACIAVEQVGCAVDMWETVRAQTTTALTVAFAVACSFASAAGSPAPASRALLPLGITATLKGLGSVGELISRGSQLEACMARVERLLQLIRVPPEASGAAEAPASGRLAFEDVRLQYSAAAGDVLRGVSFAVEPGEKVGVVGRTGAGKSSLLAALAQTTPLSGGRVRIGGVDTAAVDVRSLRARVTVVPQDPVLFSGSLRSNLDLLGEHGDAALYDVLRAVNLPALRLDDAVEAGGRNLSVGEKQLLCLGRALLRGNRIIAMDEATASVDAETDGAIQRVIREYLADATVVTIAHRLHTVLAYDKILVMDAGEVAEFGPPAELLAREGGVLAGMVGA